MQRTIDETTRKRDKQAAYNLMNNITPTQITKSTESIMGQTSVANSLGKSPKPYIENTNIDVAADPVVNYMSADQLQKLIGNTRRSMEKAAKELDFYEAARLRDEMNALKELFQKRK